MSYVLLSCQGLASFRKHQPGQNLLPSSLPRVNVSQMLLKLNNLDYCARVMGIGPFHPEDVNAFQDMNPLVSHVKVSKIYRFPPFSITLPPLRYSFDFFLPSIPSSTFFLFMRFVLISFLGSPPPTSTIIIMILVVTISPPSLFVPHWLNGLRSLFLCSLFHSILPSVVCPPATFKSVTGDELCGPCPAHSRAPYRGSTECRCDHGYYRADKDPKWFPCTRKTIILLSPFSFILSPPPFLSFFHSSSVSTRLLSLLSFPWNSLGVFTPSTWLTHPLNRFLLLFLLSF